MAGEPVWKRKFVREYLPALGVSDTSLVQFLDHHNIRSQAPTADAGDKTCAAAEGDAGLSKYTATHLYLRSKAKALTKAKGVLTEAGRAERATYAILKAKLVLFGSQ